MATTLPSCCLLLLMFRLVATVMAASGTGTGMTSCRAYRCGNAMPVHYPFWFAGGDGSSSHCGYPGMGLECRGGTAVLRLPSGDYAVSNIDYDERSFTLVDMAVTTKLACPLLDARNLTLPPPLSLTAGRNINFTLYRDCRFVGKRRHHVPCMDSADGAQQSFLFRDNGAALPDGYASLCELVVGLPVLTTGPNSKGPLVDGVVAALSKGFEVRWSAAAGEHCRACEDGGGWCGQRRDAAHGTWSFSCVPRTAPTPTPSPSGGENRANTIIFTTTLTILIVGSVMALALCWIRAHGSGEVDTEAEKELRSWNLEEITIYRFNKIATATGNFSEENKLGEGGFGPVYRGKLNGGLEIAVKRLSSSSDQGLVEFKNEIQLIAKLQHRNLVRLLGCCVHGNDKILVYEYMKNNSLDGFIFNTARSAILTWEIRFRIVEGIAQGLLYLHRHSRLRVIHRDLKAGNILLDDDMTPKISDFGFARIFPRNIIQANTQIVAGTPGYISPEYLAGGLFSMKSDVFSFGVLLLEIVSGVQNAALDNYGNYRYFTGYAYQLWKDLKWYDMVDPLIGPNYSVREVVKCIHVGLLCIQAHADDRPTMSTVVSMLASDGLTLPEPNEPAYFQLPVSTVPGPVLRRSSDVGPSSRINVT